MRNYFWIATLLFFNLSFACHCLTFKEAQKKAIETNKFILLQFGNSFEVDENLNGMINSTGMTSDEIQIINQFVYVCLPSSNANKSYYQKYQIATTPELLVVDAVGQEIYRFQSNASDEEIISFLRNFRIPTPFFANDFQQYNKQKSYTTALRLAQKYLDYSLLVDAKYKKSVYKVSSEYMAEAEKILSKKDENYIEKLQKVELYKLYHWAYEKNFSFLNQQLAALDSNKIQENNRQIFYFLKYMTSKALQQEDFSQIENQTKRLDGFDYFTKKADLILAQQG